MKNTKRPVIATTCFLVLAALNYATFQAHYSGELIFPWDFLGGYHFQSFGWFSQGSWLYPPTWFPWSGIGFPSALAVQAGGWYLPLGVLGALNVPYTFNVAAIVQVLHVLAGAVGCYLLLRRLGLEPAFALLGAVGFHFSAAFYTNQQHIDIVRAYALFPWLLWCLHPATLQRAVLMPALAALVLFQFLVSAYPGNIVTAVYACAAYFGILLLARESGRDRRNYFLAATVAVMAGAALSALKWLPFFAAAPLLETGTIAEASPFSPDYLLTLALRYDRDWFEADLTMRSLYLPLAVWFGAFFIRRLDTVVKVGLAFAALALICGMALTTLDPTDRLLPGLNLSRFPLSDWRMVLHPALAMLGCAGWKTLVDGGLTPTATSIRLLLATCLAAGACLYALHMGYTPADLRPAAPYLVIGILTALTLSTAANRRIKAMPRTLLPLAVIAILVPAAAHDGWRHQQSQSAPWAFEWNDQMETHFFGAPIKALYAAIGHEAPTRRPERFVVGEDTQEVLQNQNYTGYNRCWYAHTYCLLGYNNIRLSTPHNAIQAGLRDSDTGAALLAFLRKPSQLLLAPHAEAPGDAVLPSAPEHWHESLPGVTVEYVQYAPHRVRYRISTPTALRVTENEMWWPGWTYQACSSEGCSEVTETGHTDLYLRSWTLPPGDWSVTLSYAQAGSKASRIIAGLGLALLALHAAWLIRYRPRTSLRNSL